jgi:hypothetical protein
MLIAPTGSRHSAFADWLYRGLQAGFDSRASGVAREQAIGGVCGVVGGVQLRCPLNNFIKTDL